MNALEQKADELERENRMLIQNHNELQSSLELYKGEIFKIVKDAQTDEKLRIVFANLLTEFKRKQADETDCQSARSSVIDELYQKLLTNSKIENDEQINQINQQTNRSPNTLNFDLLIEVAESELKKM